MILTLSIPRVISKQRPRHPRPATQTVLVVLLAALGLLCLVAPAVRGEDVIVQPDNPDKGLMVPLGADDFDISHEGHPPPGHQDNPTAAAYKTSAAASRHAAFKPTGISCTQKQCSILVFVPTHVTRFSKRLMWRTTVGQHLPAGVDLVFPIALPVKELPEAVQWNLMYERMTFRDLLTVSGDDVKHETHAARWVAMLRYFVEAHLHERYKWIVKVDDDTMVHPWTLTEYFNNIPDSKVLACRPADHNAHNWCGGPLIAMRGRHMPGFLAELEKLGGVATSTWYDDILSSNLTERMTGSKDAICWSPAKFIHEPKSLNRAWSEKVSKATVAVHQLKQPHTFFESFVRWFPHMAEWEQCTVQQFKPAHCKAWRDEFASAQVCDGS